MSERFLAIAAAKAVMEHHVPPSMIVLNLLPIAREALEANREAVKQAEQCLRALEQEGRLGTLDAPDSTLGGAIHKLNEVLFNDGAPDAEAKLNIVDAIGGLLEALNGDPDDWEWNRHLATTLLAIEGSQVGEK